MCTCGCQDNRKRKEQEVNNQKLVTWKTGQQWKRGQHQKGENGKKKKQEEICSDMDIGITERGNNKKCTT